MSKRAAENGGCCASSSTCGLGTELSSPPEDAISGARFSRHSNKLLVSSWDCSVSLYDVDANKRLLRFGHECQPLDCCFLDDSSGVAGGSDGTLRRYDFSTKQNDLLGTHDGLISCVEFLELTGQLVTCSWDNSLRLWDTRASEKECQFLAGTLEQGDLVECMSHSGYTLVVAMGTITNIYDVRSLFEPVEVRQLPKMYKIMSVSCFPDGSGYAIGGVEGRVALEPINQFKSHEISSYAFRCVPTSKISGIVSSSVNAINFHPIDGTFATGDSDGYCIVWDGRKRIRLCEYPKYPASVSALSYNRDGSLLVVASSYVYQEREKRNERTQLFIQPASS